MEIIEQIKFTGERALFKSKNLKLMHCTFSNGESPLKESKQLEIYHCSFKWKYPLWYSSDIIIEDSYLLETARSGIWYTNNIQVKNCIIEAPKTFRRATNIVLDNVDIPLAQETLWNCMDIALNQVTARGDYFALHSKNITAKNFVITGNYVFDGASNIEIYDSKIISKDAFWNCENVTVYNSTIIGEYLGWNSKNIKFINCIIESEQGLCYMDNVTLKNCKLMNTTQAFEYSTVNAQLDAPIDSIMNPISGTIKATNIETIILDDLEIDFDKTKIITDEQYVK